MNTVLLATLKPLEGTQKNVSIYFHSGRCVVGTIKTVSDGVVTITHKSTPTQNGGDTTVAPVEHIESVML